VQALGLEMFSDLPKIRNLLHQIILDLMYGAFQHIRRGNEHVGRINIQALILLQYLIGCGIKSFYLFNIIPEEMNSESYISIRRKYINCISLDPEITSRKFHFSSGIKALYQPMKKLCPGNHHVPFQTDHVLLEFYRIPDPVETG